MIRHRPYSSPGPPADTLKVPKGISTSSMFSSAPILNANVGSVSTEYKMGESTAHRGDSRHSAPSDLAGMGGPEPMFSPLQRNTCSARVPAPQVPAPCQLGFRAQIARRCLRSARDVPADHPKCAREVSDPDHRSVIPDVRRLLLYLTKRLAEGATARWGATFRRQGSDTGAAGGRRGGMRRPRWLLSSRLTLRCQLNSSLLESGLNRPARDPSAAYGSPKRQRYGEKPISIKCILMSYLII